MFFKKGYLTNKNSEIKILKISKFQLKKYKFLQFKEITSWVFSRQLNAWPVVVFIYTMIFFFRLNNFYNYRISLFKIYFKKNHITSLNYCFLFCRFFFFFIIKFFFYFYKLSSCYFADIDLLFNSVSSKFLIIDFKNLFNINLLDELVREIKEKDRDENLINFKLICLGFVCTNSNLNNKDCKQSFLFLLLFLFQFKLTSAFIKKSEIAEREKIAKRRAFIFREQ